MASAKRKLATGEAPENSSKRSRSDHETSKPRSSTKNDDTAPKKIPKPVKVSILSKEEPAFPRGGADVLTPLERKQINAKASRDALKEHQRSHDLFTSGGDRADISSDEDGSQGKSSVPQKSKQIKKKSKKSSSETGSKKETTIHISGLNFKRIAAGSLILGRIHAIGNRDVTVTLPNNLVGYVPLTAISSQLNQKVQRLLDQDEKHSNDDSQADDDEENDDIALSDYVKIGQFVRVAVTSTGNDTVSTTSAGRKRIELSLDPSLTNVGLNRSSLSINSIVQAAVASVEDHGLVVDLSLEEYNVRGFVPAKALPKNFTLSQIKVGAIFLCAVTDIGSNGKIVKLSADFDQGKPLKTAASVDAFLPGTAVDILISEINSSGIAGKVMGMLDVTADVVHTGTYGEKESFLQKYKPGQKVRGRLICTFPLDEEKRLGFSLLNHIIDLKGEELESNDEPKPLRISVTVSDAVVVAVEPRLGIYLRLSDDKIGFAHISRLADKKIENISEENGPYKVGSQHQARITDYNSIDGLYMVSLQKSILEQPFLRVEDVVVGAVTKGTINRIIVGPNGVQGLIVDLANGVSGLVPQIHMSDIVLQNPEKKFREGQKVTARVLSTDPLKRQIRLTLKKALVNSDQKAWSDMNEIATGDSTVGTLMKVEQYGAIVQFYGSVKGYLPVSEMSEAYIKDATEHFRVGQVVSVNALNVNAADRRLTVSCREVNSSTQVSESTLSALEVGSTVSGTVFEKSQNDLLLRLNVSEAIARLTIDHVFDGSEKKRQSAFNKLRVGQKLEDLLVLEVQPRRRLVLVSNRSGLIKAAQQGHFLKSFEDLREDALFTGSVSSITGDGVFISFGAGISGLVPKGQMSVQSAEQPDFGVTKFQTITARVMKIDYKGATPRFWLTLRDLDAKSDKTLAKPAQPRSDHMLTEPVDESLRSTADLAVGRITKARILSIKQTQLNIELAKDVQGRVDVSEIFDVWDEIKDRKKPLDIFNTRQVIPVRVIGAHDSRNHRFLPLSHRNGKSTVYELSARPAAIRKETFEPVSFTDLAIGSSWIAYVNNYQEGCLWVNISPRVRGRIRAIDVSNDLSLASDLPGNFPLGSAIRVRVAAVDVEKERLDLTARSEAQSGPLTINDISKGLILPGRITKLSERQILVQLSDSLVGAVDLIDLADDFAEANPAKFAKNDAVRAYVVYVDASNKKIGLSLRSSKVLSSSLQAVDPEVTSFDQLEINQIRRGFVNNVSDKGIFITLGHGITAFVRISHLSDAFLKEWKDHFQRDQLVRGKIIALDKSSGQVQLSLKESAINGDYKPPLSFNDLKVGDVVTGKVVKAEAFGVFLLVDNSEKIRGLCHRSEIAEQRIDDASTLFKQGDAVKAKILKIDSANRRVNFGLKASYFADEVGSEMEDDSEIVSDDAGDENDDEDNMEVDGGVSVGDHGIDESSEDEIVLGDTENVGEQADDTENADVDYEATAVKQKTRPLSEASGGLKVGAFDWYGMSESLSNPKGTAGKAINQKAQVKKSVAGRKDPGIQIDRTGDLDTNGPQSVDDYERLLLGEPDSSLLWLQYMAFYLDLGDTDQARQIGERALKSIGLGQDAEKLNIWVALLNLENAYGDEGDMEAVFQRACEYNDAQEIHVRLASIYIQSGKQKQADEMFQRMIKKYAQDPKVWVNYATFLFETAEAADQARDLLPRALQMVPKYAHVDLTLKFAQLEFKSKHGLAERGRTVFEGLLNSFPKRIDLYSVLLDLEMKSGDQERVRGLFERILAVKLKPKQAKYFFKRWLDFEEKLGDERHIDEVKARAATWVQAAGKSDM